MSRTIKFRAWDKDSKRYGEVVGIEYNESREIDGIWVWYNIHERYEPIPGANVIVEQYTGLKDKNGKEIYEGDRIKIEGSDTVYTVEYGRGVWVARFGDESGDNICLFHYVQKDMVLYAEVIGNIHENPELSEGK